MHWPDALVLLILGASALLAFLRGFVREVMGIAAWVVAIAAGFFLSPALAPLLSRWTGASGLAQPLAFGAVFLVSLILLSLVAGWIGGLIQLSPLGGIDRLLGLLFGLVRGALLLSVAYLLAGMAVPQNEWPQTVLQARSMPYLYRGAIWIAAAVPARYRPAVFAPPGFGPPPVAAPPVATPAPATAAPATPAPATPAPATPAVPTPAAPAAPANQG